MESSASTEVHEKRVYKLLGFGLTTGHDERHDNWLRKIRRRSISEKLDCRGEDFAFA
ncbi:hypothetical protein F2Q70_00011187 [Brassica cretica]|uniref:Uncharacterized protein n=1 Tax=Brassica cretica TaxID=69181 RepID=A0A8S9MB48_BRACR|nr:hypothetical protein F2Q68_00004303 [Brassica cretica]KAF2615747.1 hypothetical protein F2Q70_00011187 [Brassica cretica]